MRKFRHDHGGIPDTLSVRPRRMINVLEYLESTCHRCPDRLAVTDRDGCLTFNELRTEARTLAARIAALTGARNQPVGVYLPQSRHCVTAFPALLYSGKCYAPLALQSPP